MNVTAEFVYAISALLCAVVGSAYDVARHRIPNFVTLPAILAGLTLHLLLGGPHQLVTSAMAGLLCGLIFLAFYLAGGMGGGDVKLIAAVGCLSGLSLVGSLLIFTSLAGGVMAIVLALYRHRIKETLRNVLSLFIHHKSEGLTPHPELNISNQQTLRLPYGLAIAAGSALSLCLSVSRTGIR